MPHLWWQYEHHWVSFKYHLFENHVNQYKIKYTLDYFLGQVLLAGPLAGFVLIPAAFLFKSFDDFTRALKFTLVGFYVFFLLSSFRGNVEPNWTAPVMIPLIILSHQYLTNHYKWSKWLFRLLPATLVVVLFARIGMIKDFIPMEIVRTRYHYWRNWPQELRELTRGENIVFSNSYQRASKYWFYSGQMTYSQNHAHERRNNFNFWPIEDSINGKPAWFIDIFDLYRFKDTIKTPYGYLGYKHDSAFYSFAKISFIPEKYIYSISKTDSFTLTATPEVPAHYKPYLDRVAVSDIRLCVYDKYGWIKDLPTNYKLQDLTGPITITVFPQLKPGKYFLRISISANNNNPTHNRQKILLKIW
jgi:hypothetical protein